MHPATALWEIPASLLLLLLAQPGPDRKGRSFGTAAEELSRTIEIPESFDGS